MIYLFENTQPRTLLWWPLQLIFVTSKSDPNGGHPNNAYLPLHDIPFWKSHIKDNAMHSGGNLGVRLGLELDKNIFKSIQKYFKSIQKYLTHTNSGLAHPKLFGSKYFWYVKYFYSYMSLFGQKLKFCFLCPMKTNFGKKWWKHKCLP